MHRPVARLALALFACNPTSDSEDGSATTTGTGTGTTEPVDIGSTSSATTTELPTSTTTPPAACLNGVVDEGEDCDDANSVNGDGCNNDCTRSGTLLVEHRSGDPAFDYVYSIAIDADGIVVGGKNGSSGWLARYSNELVPQWTKTYEPQQIVRAVALTDGAMYVAGALLSDADGRDLWVARLDADGAIVWEDTLSGGEGDDWATQAELVDGDLIVAGMAFGTMQWLRRYSPDGTIQWTATAPSGHPYSNIFPLGGGLVVTATSAVIGWNVLENGLYPEQLLGYPLTGGEPTWTATLPQTHGVINAIAADPGGDLVLAVAENFETLTVHRVQAMNQILWSSDKCVGSIARDVAIDSQGDIVVIGDGPAKGGDNIRLCKFTADGTLRWGQDFDGGVGDDFGFTVTIDSADRILAGGGVLAGQDDRDAWLAVFSP